MTNQADPKINLTWWISRERAHYANHKYADGTQTRDELVEEIRSIGFGPQCQAFVGNYLKRAELLGLNTPLGRQAMGKAIVTLMHFLETAISIHGLMPPGGLQSGQLKKEK